MGIALNDGAVHERAGVALVRIADEILLVALRVARRVPLEPGGEARAAAPGKTRDLDLLDHLLRRHRRAFALAKNLGDRLVAVSRTVRVKGLGIDHPAMPERDARLLREELLVLIQNLEILHAREVAGCRCLVDASRVLLLHAHEPRRERIAVVQIHDRLEIAHADAAGHADLNRRATALAQILKRRAHLARAGGDSAAPFTNHDPQATEAWTFYIFHFTFYIHDAAPSVLIFRTISRALSGVSEP